MRFIDIHRDIKTILYIYIDFKRAVIYFETQRSIVPKPSIILHFTCLIRAFQHSYKGKLFYIKDYNFVSHILFTSTKI